MEEIWKEVEVNGLTVLVSSKGRIAKVLPPYKVGKYAEYDAVWLNKNVSVHRLVAETFIPNPDNKPQINHKNGNKSNNEVENLEWCTNSENTKHAWDSGLVGKRKKLKE